MNLGFAEAICAGRRGEPTVEVFPPNDQPEAVMGGVSPSDSGAISETAG